FGFPKGARPGTCLHKIFEEINFADAQTFSEVIIDNLSLYNIDKKWNKVIEKMVVATVQKQLLGAKNALSLSAIKPDQLVREMEFYYSTADIKTADMVKIIRGNGINIPQNRSAEGFLKGFIDLTFEFKGKFYLLDYKSNYLGDTVEDYGKEAMRDEMVNAS